MTAPQHVTSADGTRIATYRHGRGDGPVIVAVHGYPDNHTVWDGVVVALAGRHRVVTYDVRGAGASDQPADRSAYRMARLVDDLRAVLDDVSPGRPAHLLAHDWGSIQTWAAVSDPALRDRIASYTSISGPCLDHVRPWIRSARPRHVLKQALESYYIALFHIPGLAELAWRRAFAERALARMSRIGRSPQATATVAQRSTADKINGLELYRANMLRHLFRPAPVRTDVPVQVLAPRRDPFVSVALQTEAPSAWVHDLRVHELAGGHWVITDQPEHVARLTADFVDEFEAADTAVRDAR
jgi:pimeloyl-ACP methyl ester carboxylesterase